MKRFDEVLKKLSEGEKEDRIGSIRGVARNVMSAVDEVLPAGEWDIHSDEAYELDRAAGGDDEKRAAYVAAIRSRIAGAVADGVAEVERMIAAE